MAQNMVNNQNKRKNLKSTLTECHENWDVTKILINSKAKLSIKSN